MCPGDLRHSIGKRKSIQPMAARLAEVHEQALNKLPDGQPWDPCLRMPFS